MATVHNNLSTYDSSKVPNASSTFGLGLFFQRWNESITTALHQGAVNTLLEHEVPSLKLPVGRYQEVMN